MEMKFISLPIYFNEKFFTLNSVFGMLLEIDNYNEGKTIAIPQKVINALGYCNSPYNLTKCESRGIKKTINENNILKIYANFLTTINKLNFGLGRFCSNIGQPVFDNATDSILFFRKNKPGVIQNDLCLPRSLFAGSTSKLFKQKGVIFIGVLLPSNSMHAWIIEDCKQPDPLDNMWTNFQPVAAIY